jgi:type VI secretion system protein ImpF
MKNKRLDIQGSILNRLIDDAPGVSSESSQQRAYDFSRIKAAVVNDLENLLNTKGFAEPLPPSYKELNSSLYIYGLRDFTAHNPQSPSVRQRLRLEIENAVSRFEPRLRNVSVRIETPARNERTLRFRITGVLVADPLSEQVTFDTYFDLNKGEYVITK